MRTVTLKEVLDGPVEFGPCIHTHVVDLYAGVGGFSTGAELAGHSVKIAIEGWADALAWHHKNHPETDHYRYWLPDNRLLERLPPPRTKWHLHGSPPCTLLSKVHNTEDHRSRWDEGLENVKYYIELARTTEPASWSMEQVNNKVVIQLLNEYVKLYPEFIDYEVIKMEQYGVPQMRKRLIAGSPWLIQRLRDIRGSMPRKRARDGCSTIPEEAIGIKGQRQNKSGDVRSRTPAFQTVNMKIAMDRRMQHGGLSSPAPTVLCSNALMWAKVGGHTIRCLNVREHADYQTFPSDYKFPDNCCLAQTLVGNSVPPAFAKVLMDNYRLPMDRHQFPDPDFPSRPPSPCAHTHTPTH